MRCSHLQNVPHVTTPWRGGSGENAARDMELIRELLFEIEGGGAGRALDGWSDEQLRDHLRLLIEAGLLHGTAEGSGGVAFGKLTWAGHDFLASVKQDAVWRKIRAHLNQAGGGIAFDGIKQLALSYLP